MINHRTWASLQRSVWALLHRTGALSTPVSNAQLERIARLQGALIIDSPSMTSLHGCLSATAAGLVIRVNPRLSPSERRYAIAHEIGHTLIDHDIPFLRTRLAAKLEHPLNISSTLRERLCDLIAAELLVPQLVLAAEMTCHASPELAIGKLASEFRTVESGLFLQFEMSGSMQSQFVW